MCWLPRVTLKVHPARWSLLLLIRRAHAVQTNKNPTFIHLLHFQKKLLILENSRNLFPRKWQVHRPIAWMYLYEKLQLSHMNNAFRGPWPWSREDITSGRSPYTHPTGQQPLLLPPPGRARNSHCCWQQISWHCHQACNCPLVTSEVRLGAKDSMLQCWVSL